MAKNLKKDFALLIAEFFFLGRSPIAPGTVGSLGSLVIWIPAIIYGWPWLIILFLLFAIFFIGTWASTYAIERYQAKDPKQAVIDEVVGQGIPFLIISPNFIEILLAFMLFRFFDIAKPWPIKYIERTFPNAFGLMLDDVLAGIMALLTIWIGKLLFV